MWTTLIPLVGKVLDNLLPDEKANAEAKLKFMEMAQRGELAVLDADTKVALGQAAINQEEAKSQNLFKSGWRPAAGWLCVVGLGYQLFLRPLLPWLLTVSGIDGVPELPAIDTSELVLLLGGLLGLGTLRTAEKVKGKNAP